MYFQVSHGQSQSYSVKSEIMDVAKKLVSEFMDVAQKQIIKHIVKAIIAVVAIAVVARVRIMIWRCLVGVFLGVRTVIWNCLPYTERWSKLETAQEQIISKVDMLTEQLRETESELKKDRAEVIAELEHTKAKLSALESESGKQREELDSIAWLIYYHDLQEELNSTKAKLSALESEDRKQQEELNCTKAKLSELESDAGKQQEELDNLSEKYKKYKKKLKDEIAERQKAEKELENKVEELERRLELMDKDVKHQKELIGKDVTHNNQDIRDMRRILYFLWGVSERKQDQLEHSASRDAEVRRRSISLHSASPPDIGPQRNESVLSPESAQRCQNQESGFASGYDSAKLDQQQPTTELDQASSYIGVSK